MPYTCSAFTRYTPCSHKVDKEFSVCSQHTDFYNESRWLQEYILEPYDSKRDSFTLVINNCITNVIRKAILEKHIIVTKEHLETVYTRMGTASLDYYLLCCNQSQVDPLWIWPLWEEFCIMIYLRHQSILSDVVKGDPRFLYEYLKSIFDPPSRSHCLSELFFELVVIELSPKYKKYAKYISTRINNPNGSLLQFLSNHPNRSSWIYPDLGNSETYIQPKLDLFIKKLKGSKV
jgi:hypothetical protein